MSFFDRSDEPPGGEAEREEVERIERGGIPLAAEARLRSLGEGAAPFTSTLSVGEFALLSELGPSPLGQVLGASVHQVGWQFLPVSARWGGTVYCELDRVAHAWDQARRRSFDRLVEEALQLGADAVIGVRLRRGEHDWAAGSVDYTVVGTAIRLPGATGARYPGLSDLSVQEYWKLVRAGWTPAGLCAATSVFFIAQSTGTAFNRFVTGYRNQELTEYSRGFQLARETAVRYLRSQAGAAGADGIVGVTLDHRITHESIRTYASSTSSSSGGRDEREGLVVTIQAVGTAITRAGPPGGPATATTLRLGASS